MDYYQSYWCTYFFPVGGTSFYYSFKITWCLQQCKFRKIIKWDKGGPILKQELLKNPPEIHFKMFNSFVKKLYRD